MRPSSRRLLRFALPTLAALGAGAAVAVADFKDADGTIHACINPKSNPPGAVRIIDAATQTCTAAETPLSWNQQGLPGAQGDPGPPGPQGDPGPPADTSTDSSSSTTTTPDTFSTPTQAGGPSADMFLRLDGIAGSSTDDKHKGEIDVSSFAFALGHGGDGTGTSGVAATTGSSSAKARLQTLRIDKVYDAASPKLFRAAATGQHIRSGTLTFRRTDDSGGLEFLTYTLTDVQVTSYDQGGKDGDERDLGSLEEEVGLTAARVRATEQTVDADGKKGPVVTAQWTVPKAAAAKKKPAAGG